MPLLRKENKKFTISMNC